MSERPQVRAPETTADWVAGVRRRLPFYILVANFLALLALGLIFTSWVELLQAAGRVMLLGWVLIAVVEMPSVVQILWALAGLLIFGGLAATWFANLMTSESQSSNVSLTIDLFILGMNLLVAGRVKIGAVV